jgi:hypothetical protein
MTNLTNLETYRAIARAALAASQAAHTSHKVTMADGTPGVVVTLDPAQASFKHSLVAIVFACISLEALLYMAGTQRLGSDYPDRGTYEDKLRALGVADRELLEAAERLRSVRRSIVHEKAAAVSDVTAFYAAQTEAAKALALIDTVSALFPALAERDRS